MDTTSLRERSKQRRRRNIRDEGMRLFAEQGYDATTVVEIAAAAEVSPRSVFTYFPTKLDIAAASANAAADRLSTAFESSPPGRAVADVFVAWFEDESTFVDEHEWELRARMMRANPVLTASATPHAQKLMAVTSHAIARELRVGLEDPAVQLAIGILSGLVLQGQLLPGARRADADIVKIIRAAAVGAFAGIHEAVGELSLAHNN